MHIIHTPYVTYAMLILNDQQNGERERGSWEGRVRRGSRMAGVGKGVGRGSPEAELGGGAEKWERVGLRWRGGANS